MPKVILDTDPGVDDAMAIAYAFCHPEIQLLGLTTVFGNINIDFATRNAMYILDQLGAVDVAVAKGAAAPSVRPPQASAEFVHGADGLGNQYPESTPEKPASQSATLNASARHANIEALDAADFIIQSARETPGEITLVAVGPLTNIAEALRREPKLPSLVQQLVVMGGALDEPGNVSPVAEANFLNDPHAADEVFSVDWPATIVGLDVTHRIMIGDSHLNRVGSEAGQTGKLIRQTSKFYVDFYTTKGAAASAHDAGAEPQCAMHDAAAIACVLIPDAFTTIAGPARVISESVAIGQLAVDRKGYQYALSYWENLPDTAVCMEVDAPRVLNHFLDTLIDHHLN